MELVFTRQYFNCYYNDNITNISFRASKSTVSWVLMLPLNLLILSHLCTPTSLALECGNDVLYISSATSTEKCHVNQERKTEWKVAKQ